MGFNIQDICAGCYCYLQWQLTLSLSVSLIILKRLNIDINLNSTKLRARQKERLARRNAVGGSQAVDGLPGTEPLLQSFANAKSADLGTGPSNLVGDASINLEENKSDILLEAQKSHADSITRMGRLSKHIMGSLTDATVNNLDHSPPHYMGSNITNSMPTSNMLPVLGLCAPSTSQVKSSEGNLPKLHWRQNRRGARQEFPFSLAPSSGTTSLDADFRSQEGAANVRLPDSLAHILQESFKNRIPDHNLPFVPVSSPCMYSRF